MKITLSDQLIEAELHRKALEKASFDNFALLDRLHRAEAICLTLAMYEANEIEFRQFMAERSAGTNQPSEGA